MDRDKPETAILEWYLFLQRLLVNKMIHFSERSCPPGTHINCFSTNTTTAAIQKIKILFPEGPPQDRPRHGYRWKDGISRDNTSTYRPLIGLRVRGQTNRDDDETNRL